MKFCPPKILSDILIKICSYILIQVCDGSLTTSWVEGDHAGILKGHGAEEIANIITAFSS